MILYFNDVDVSVNGTGVLAENASISTSNSIQPVGALGLNGIVDYPAGTQQINIKLSYFTEPGNDPSYGILNGYKTKNDNVSIPINNIVISNLTGYGYLDSYSLQVLPNQPVKTESSFVCFVPITGFLVASTGGIDYRTGTALNTLHGWTTSVSTDTGNSSIELDSLGYNCNINLVPIYVLGNKIPIQVDLMGGSEKFEFSRDEFFNFVFRGGGIEGHFFNPDANPFIEMAGFLNSGDKSNVMTFNFSGSRITDGEVSAQINDKVNSTISCIKDF